MPSQKETLMNFYFDRWNISFCHNYIYVDEKENTRIKIEFDYSNKSAINALFIHNKPTGHQYVFAFICANVINIQ